MKLFITVKPRAKMEKVERIDGTHFIINVREPPLDGRANEAIKKALAEYFDVSNSRVRIIFGFSSRHKVIEI